MMIQYWNYSSWDWCTSSVPWKTRRGRAGCFSCSNFTDRNLTPQIRKWVILSKACHRHRFWLLYWTSRTCKHMSDIRTIAKRWRVHRAQPFSATAHVLQCHGTSGGFELTVKETNCLVIGNDIPKTSLSRNNIQLTACCNTSRTLHLVKCQSEPSNE